MKWMSIEERANTNVAQLIDANLDRAREGLRVIEDWCRFGLSQKDLVITLKDWRQQLGKYHRDIYKQARSTASDQGLGLTHPLQKERCSPEKIVAANCSRVQEALRVLEEFSRSNDPDLAKIASRIRYGLYDLEKSILKATSTKKRHQKLLNCKLCLITSSQENLSQTIENALKAGIEMVQYRCKDGSDHERLIQARQLSALCKMYKSLLIINDRIDIALAVDADGVHLGQEDFPTNLARDLLGNEKLIGRSVHCLEDLEIAQKEGCDYLGVGPVYATLTKPDEPPAGINFIKRTAELSQLPWFAIGGINNTNLNEVISAGAKRIAVVSAVMNANNPYQASLELLKKMP